MGLSQDHGVEINFTRGQEGMSYANICRVGKEKARQELLIMTFKVLGSIPALSNIGQNMSGHQNASQKVHFPVCYPSTYIYIYTILYIVLYIIHIII